jgi:uncharacterized heparinase superfamily protein
VDFPDVPLVQPAGFCGRDVVAGLAVGVFRHLNQERTLGRDSTDWLLGPRTADRLWIITLHYHAWLYALAEAATRKQTNAAQATELLRSYLANWLRRCALDQPGARELAWNAFAVATRIGWWVRTYRTLAPGSLGPEFLASLWQQATYLHDHLEWDLRANHLLRDAVGLAWAGRFFAEPQARQWLTTAAQLARQQTREQVLPDGGHFERSPMYHLQIMEDLSALICLLEDPAAVGDLRSAWSKMAEFLRWVQHPDGNIPLLNDAADNGAACPGDMLALGDRLEASPQQTASAKGGRHFSDTGLAVWHGGLWSVFFDVGPVGPNYQPGHAHADTLTIECSFRGQQLFVDPGTFAYDNDERRCYDRATASHNTVSIDGEDSSEVWHIFRMGRRALPMEVQVRFDNSMEATAGHTGYHHLPGRPSHRRTVRIDEPGALVIHDRAEGSGIHHLQGGYLLTPEWSVSDAAEGWRLASQDRQVRVVVTGPAGIRRSQRTAWYHPEFGREQNTQRLEWSYEGPLPVEVRTEVKSG